ncbi:hypothetical protein T01_4743 [Trichinella spiralis]|uniref:Uncharacterized protein n=1 Tax=Trichinella spiralis TaxID=6334 RepID=A0A0V1BE76_TRISP|nr:hypothetical protein T01_4743 [Trichinella spiralis]
MVRPDGTIPPSELVKEEGSFTLQDGAHFWSLHPPPALNISSPTPGMFAISQNSFMPDFICLFKEPFTLNFGKSHLLQRVDTYLS